MCRDGIDGSSSVYYTIDDSYSYETGEKKATRFILLIFVVVRIFLELGYHIWTIWGQHLPNSPYKISKFKKYPIVDRYLTDCHSLYADRCEARRKTRGVDALQGYLE